MRILRIADIPDNRTTGMTRAMYGSGDALAAAGHQVDYLFMDRIGGIRLPRVRRFATPLRLPAVLRRMMQAAKTYDIVEVHETLAAPLLFLRRFQRGIPAVVLFCHGLAIRAHAADLEYRKLKGLPVSIRNRYSPLAEVFQAMYAIRRSDHILCCNSDDVQYLVDSGVPSSFISVHQNGVSDSFLRAGADLVDAASTRSGILFLGSWVLRKGIPDLVPAITRVLKNHPGISFTAAGCSCSQESIRAGFPPPLRGQIDVLPHLATDNDIIRTCAKRSVFVLPSFAEGQPLAMMEAAALGMAIVTTDSPGMRDFIQNDVNGLLIGIGDPDALADRLERLVNSPQDSRRLGEAARKKVQDFTWTNAARTLEEAYGKAVDRARKKSVDAKVVLA